MLERPSDGSCSRTASAAARSARCAGRLGAEQHVEPVGRAVGDRERHVGVHHVVDQRDVLVADPLDVVLAEAVAEQGRALERLDGDGQRAVTLLEVVAGRDRAGRAGRGNERPQPQAGAERSCSKTAPGPAGGEVVRDVVPELGELVEDHVLRVGRELGAAVVDLLDVALRARRPDRCLVGAGTQRSSQSNRSRLMPSGRTATPRQPIRREIATPPRQ